MRDISDYLDNFAHKIGMMKSLVLAMMLFANGTAFSQEWNNNLETALGKAGNEGKSVLLFFSVPENCAICEALEKNVWESEIFKAYAKDNFILARPDFHDSVPLETKADNLLIVEKYNKDGFFPWVVILDRYGKVLGKTGIYNDEAPEAYLRMLKTIIKK